MLNGAQSIEKWHQGGHDQASVSDELGVRTGCFFNIYVAVTAVASLMHEHELVSGLLESLFQLKQTFHWVSFLGWTWGCEIPL